MRVRGKFLALGAAGVVALGGAGLYAGTLSTTATGTLGAGEVAVQSSCASTVNVTPGDSTYDSVSKRFEYTDVDLGITEATADSCNDKWSKVTVFASDTGAKIAESTAAVQIDSTDTTTAASANLTLDAGVDSGDSNQSYAVVIQDSEN